MEHEKIVEMLIDYNSKLNPQFDAADCEHIVRFTERVLNAAQMPVKNRVWGGTEA